METEFYNSIIYKLDHKTDLIKPYLITTEGLIDITDDETEISRQAKTFSICQKPKIVYELDTRTGIIAPYYKTKRGLLPATDYSQGILACHYSFDELTLMAKRLYSELTSTNPVIENISIWLQKLEQGNACITSLDDTITNIAENNTNQSLEELLRNCFSGNTKIQELRLALNLIGIITDDNAIATIVETFELVGNNPTRKDIKDVICPGLNILLKSSLQNKIEIYAILISFNRDIEKRKKLKVEYEKQFGNKLNDDIETKFAGDLNALSYALYLVNEPGIAIIKEGLQQLFENKDKEKVEYDSNIAGNNSIEYGQVELKTNVCFNSLEDSFMITYTGIFSSERRWLQFLWRELIFKDTTGGTRLLKKTFELKADETKKLQTTTNLSNKIYGIDCANNEGSPFYEDTEPMGVRKYNSIGIVDKPTGLRRKKSIKLVETYATQHGNAGINPITNISNPNNTNSITYILHFITFLIQDNKPIYQIEFDIEWVYTNFLLYQNPFEIYI
jgi:hypothetical protein